MSNAFNERLSELEALDEDLFDFPDVNGMADLLAAERYAAAERDAPDSPRAPLPAPRPAASDADLDDDLFAFDELVELSAVKEFDSEPSDLDPAPPAPALTPAPSASPAPSSAQSPAQSPAPSPARPAPARAAEPLAPDAGAREVPRSERSAPFPPSAALDPMLLAPPAALDLPPARSKLLWVLVGCFLLANTGVFLLTQQQSESVNRALMSVSNVLADALAKGAAEPARVAPPVVAPVEVAPPPQNEAPAPEPAPLDPRDHLDPSEFGVEHARRLIERGAYAEARRSLYFVLANQGRAPISNALREDIDFLIALTYFDQGRSIVEEARE